MTDRKTGAVVLWVGSAGYDSVRSNTTSKAHGGDDDLQQGASGYVPLFAEVFPDRDLNRQNHNMTRTRPSDCMNGDFFAYYWVHCAPLTTEATMTTTTTPQTRRSHNRKKMSWRSRDDGIFFRIFQLVFRSDDALSGQIMCTAL